MDVHVIGVGKDQYNEYLDQMVEGRILPWTEDSQSEGYPVWTDWEAGQRYVYFLNRNGIVDTTFNITPYDPGNPDDYTYIMNLILNLRNEDASNDGIDYQSGWNMVGLPLEVEDTYYQTLFPDAFNNALYSFDGSYSPVEYLVPGTGYLIRLSDGGIVEFSGITIDELTLSLTEGWNLISGISTSVDADVLYSSGLVVTGGIYGYDGSYFNADIIDPGMGYWVRALADGDITLSSSDVSAKSIEMLNYLSDANTLELSNGTHSTTLFFGKDVPEGEELNYSLPPTFPQMAFDARFTDNMKYAKDLDEISIINIDKDLTLSYTVNIHLGDYMEWALITESGEEYVLSGTDEIVLNQGTTRMNLKKRAIFPQVYTLHQNYPNPFNPVTKITYQLPEESYVAVTIYNLAGQKVATLVEGRRSGGFHAVDWYGKKSNGESVASGLYFFRIETENFSKTLKMLLLK